MKFFPPWWQVLASVLFFIGCGVVIISWGGWQAWALGIFSIVFGVFGGLWQWVLRRRAKRDAHAWESTPPAVSVPIAPPYVREVVPLSEADRARAQAVLDVLHRAGVLPEKPPFMLLEESLADYGEADMESVLMALTEAHAYHDDFDEARYLANLRFHPEQIEQYADTLREYIADMAQLAGQEIIVERLDCADTPENGRVAVNIRLNAGGQIVVLQERFFRKNLNPLLYEATAQALAAAGAPRRLAVYATDSGLWLAGLAPDVDIAALQRESGAHWQWRFADEGLWQEED